LGMRNGEHGGTKPAKKKDRAGDKQAGSRQKFGTRGQKEETSGIGNQGKNQKSMQEQEGEKTQKTPRNPVERGSGKNKGGEKDTGQVSEEGLEEKVGSNTGAKRKAETKRHASDQYSFCQAALGMGTRTAKKRTSWGKPHITAPGPETSKGRRLGEEENPCEMRGPR